MAVEIMITYDCEPGDTRAKATAQAGYAELQELIGKMKEGVDQRRANANQLFQLITTFEAVAKAHFACALTLIEDPSIPPLNRSAYLYRALDHLREHVLLLSDVIRVPSRAVFSRDRELLLTNMIHLIARRLPAAADAECIPDCIPDLLPVPTSSFKYVHFRYMDCFGLIGVPAEMALEHSDNRHWSVLWNEVAGHAMAIARECPGQTLEDWAESVATKLESEPEDQEPKLWERYREYYRESASENLPLPELDEEKDQGILADLKKPYLTHFLDPTAIRRTLEWQVDWLTEFLEDLYWVMVLKDEPDFARAALQAMVNALVMRYPSPLVGDIKHPPLQLRLLVAMAYLTEGDLASIAEMAEDFACGGTDVFGLNDPDNHRLAKVIADYCREEIIDKNLLYGSTISDEEKKLARFILDPTSTESITGIVDATSLASSLRPNADRLKQDIDKAKTFDDLTKIKFTEVDLNIYVSGSGFPPPPPPTNS